MILGALLAVAIPSCGKKEPVRGVAMVGDAVLTMDDVHRGIDTSSGGGEERIRQFVASWVNRELLYQEAKRRGVEEEPPFAARIADVRKQLAVQAFLDRTVFSDSAEIPDSLLLAYFNQHTNEFVLREDLVQVNSVTFRSREDASKFANLVAQGSEWNNALEQLRAELPSEHIIASTSHGYYTQRTLFPPELWKAATVLNFGEVSFPIKTPYGFVILQPLSLSRQGKTPAFDAVRSEVRQQIILTRGRQRLDDLMATLRKQYPVRLLLNSSTTSDSIPQPSNE